MAKLISRKTDDEIYYILAQRLRCSPEQAKETMESMIDTISRCIVENETVHIRKLGCFYLRKRATSRARNFENKMTTVPAYYMIRFKPCTSLKDKIKFKMQKKEAAKE